MKKRSYGYNERTHEALRIANERGVTQHDEFMKVVYEVFKKYAENEEK